MALQEQTFNSGTEGAVVTTGSMAADGAVATGITGGIYAAAGALHGARGVKFAGGIATSETFRYAFTASNKVAVSGYFKFPPVGVPASGMRIIQFGRAAAFADVNLMLINTEKARIQFNSTTLWSQTGLLVGGEWYYYTVSVDADTDTIKFELWNGAGDTLIESTTITSQALAAGYTDFRAGKAGAADFTADFYMDTLRFDPVSSTLIPPYVPAITPPFINITETPGISVVDARTSVSGDSTALTYSISPTPAGLTEPVDGLFLIPQTTSEQTFTVTVTQSGIGYTDTVVVAALPSGLLPVDHTNRKIWTGSVWD